MGLKIYYNKALLLIINRKKKKSGNGFPDSYSIKHDKFLPRKRVKAASD